MGPRCDEKGINTVGKQDPWLILKVYTAEYLEGNLCIKFFGTFDSYAITYDKTSTWC